MEYECQSISVGKLLVGATGVALPLCNSCTAPDCTNPIREKTISVFGKPTKLRLWVLNNSVRQVISCKGYVASGDTEEND